jgi:hypothetical protein
MIFYYASTGALLAILNHAPNNRTLGILQVKRYNYLLNADQSITPKTTKFICI